VADFVSFSKHDLGVDASGVALKSLVPNRRKPPALEKLRVAFLFESRSEFYFVEWFHNLVMSKSPSFRLSMFAHFPETISILRTSTVPVANRIFWMLFVFASAR
jgi:hypothetical protein